MKHGRPRTHSLARIVWVLAIIATCPALSPAECIAVRAADPVARLKSSKAVYVARVMSVDERTGAAAVTVIRAWKGKEKAYTWTGARVEEGAYYLAYAAQRGAVHHFEAECDLRPIPVSEGARDITLLNRYRGYQRLVVDDAPPRPPEAAVPPASLMTFQDLTAVPSQPPDVRSAYGEEPDQHGELRVPLGPGPHPVVVLIHGGCFKAAYANASDLASMGDALKALGIASWNVEYRRLGQAGGGWPGTYLDVGRAVDHLRTLAGPHALDLGRVVIVGHSAGGHLALWAAARGRVPAGSAIATADPLPVRGVIDLAGPVDMAANIAGYEGLCRDTVITTLLGGTPASVPERYAHTSAMKLLPFGIPQVIVIGEHEDFLPRPIAEAYAKAAARAGDPVRLIVIPGVGHFEIASPRASTWPQVLSAIRALLDGKLPPASAAKR